MREKFELLIQINTSIEKGEIPNLDDIFHADYLYLKDNTLVNQSYIKDSKISVEDYVKSIDKDLSITSFVRVSLV